MRDMLTSIGEAICLRGTSILLQSTVFLVGGFGVARAFRRYGPVFRSHLYRALTAAIAALAFASILRPTTQKAVVNLSAASAESFYVDNVVSGGGGTLAVGPAGSSQEKTSAPNFAASRLSAASGFSLEPKAFTPSLEKSGLPSTGTSKARTLPLSLASVLGLVWLLVSALLLSRLGWGYCRIAGLRKRARTCSDPIILSMLEEGATLVESAEVSGPFLAGILRPTIYLPSSAAADMDRRDLESALLHEIAHIQAHDCQWTLARRILCALMWPQPLVWLLVRAATQSAEEAADQQVLSRGKNELDYARCLLRLAESHQTRSLAGVGLGVAESRSSVGRRIERMLGSSGKLLRCLSRKAQFGLAGGVVVLASISLALISCTGIKTVVAQSRTAQGSLGHRRGLVEVADWTPPPGYADNFSLAKGKGWSIRPPLWLPNLSDKPVNENDNTPNHQKLSPEDRSLIQEVVQEGDTHILYPLKTHPEDIKKLQAFLVQHPKFAYAEYALGSQYRRLGEQAEAMKWYEASLEDAPVILARRIQYDDGRPLANFKMCGEEIGLSDRNEWSAGFAAQTDANGCYYLPVWDNELVSFGLMSSPFPSAVGTKRTEFRIAGGTQQRAFLPQSRVVLMPPIIARDVLVRPNVDVEYPFDKSTNNLRPMKLNERMLTLRWRPYPHATSYQIGMNETYYLDARGTSTDRMVTLPNVERDGWAVRTKNTSYTLPLAGYRPALNPKHIYMFLVTAIDKNGQRLSYGWSSFFMPTAALGPIELTKENLEKVAPEGVSVVSFERQGNEITAILDRGKKRTFGDLISGASFRGYAETPGRPTGPNQEGIVFKPAIDYGPWTPPGMKRRRG